MATEASSEPHRPPSSVPADRWCLLLCAFNLTLTVILLMRTAVVQHQHDKVHANNDAANIYDKLQNCRPTTNRCSNPADDPRVNELTGNLFILSYDIVLDALVCRRHPGVCVWNESSSFYSSTSPKIPKYYLVNITHIYVTLGQTENKHVNVLVEILQSSFPHS